ncbi:hypothetical protein ABZW11_17270 [Nonomuraea sp. NPDC004580]|uniref:hypothetical protein n=1 Tax=Nonomuraea sp. NPDC004580 TaxID=3154552 RepID=UPI0033B2EE1D
MSAALTYEQALAAARKVGNANADDAGAMALYCADILQHMVGAASPKLVWEGAQKAGMTHLQLALLAQKDPAAVHDLMWD